MSELTEQDMRDILDWVPVDIDARAAFDGHEWMMDRLIACAKTVEKRWGLDGVVFYTEHLGLTGDDARKVVDAAYPTPSEPF